jgi:hypothetical protein
MKSLIHAVVAAAVVSVPVVSFAQSDAPLTRAQVQAELAQLVQAGYNPANANTVDYPGNIQATVAGGAGQDTGYGPAVSGSSQAGRPTSTSGMKPIFFGQ